MKYVYVKQKLEGKESREQLFCCYDELKNDKVVVGEMYGAPAIQCLRADGSIAVSAFLFEDAIVNIEISNELKRV